MTNKTDFSIRVETCTNYTYYLHVYFVINEIEGKERNFILLIYVHLLLEFIKKETKETETKKRNLNKCRFEN